MQIDENKSHLQLTCQYRNFTRKPTVMNTKLTLNVDKAIIEQAKAYAKSQKISLSRLIESYLASLTSQKRDDFEITPLVESLSGVMKIDSDYDYKEEYSDHLTKKYR